MRLISTDTENGLRLVLFNDPSSIPPYAILSHRWGNDEVLYEHIIAEGTKEESRFDKMKRCCEKARSDGYAYVWIDTCCIDQKSSAELSESINSMYLWYQLAAVCYAYLHDVPTHDSPRDEDSFFRKSEWFTRGWTLQELIAPKDIVFLSRSWDEIGTKTELADTINAITRVDKTVLCGEVKPADVCVAKKMSWAANRRTTKTEDRAYSLLGLFGVNMTTIYGEGERAFIRLQHEIIRQSSDHSIFAWDWSIPRDTQAITPSCGLLAPSPDHFYNPFDIVTTPFSLYAKKWKMETSVAEYQVTNAGIRITLPLIDMSWGLYFAPLACQRRDTGQPSIRPYSIALILQLGTQNHYSRRLHDNLVNIDLLVGFGLRWTVRQVYVDAGSEGPVTDKDRGKYFEVVVAAPTLAALHGLHGYTFSKRFSSGTFYWQVPGSLRDYDSVEVLSEDCDLVGSAVQIQQECVLEFCFTSAKGQMSIPLRALPELRPLQVSFRRIWTVPLIGASLKRYIHFSDSWTPVLQQFDGYHHCSFSLPSCPIVDIMLIPNGRRTPRKISFLMVIELRSQ